MFGDIPPGKPYLKSRARPNDLTRFGSIVFADHTVLDFFQCWCSSMIERLNRNQQMERSNPPAGSN